MTTYSKGKSIDPGAMETPQQTPEEIWSAYDALQEKIQTQNKEAAQPKGRVKQRA